MNGVAPQWLLVADSAPHQGNRRARRDQAAQRANPPGKARENDGHLQGEKSSHEGEAGAEQANLRERRWIELPVRRPI